VALASVFAQVSKTEQKPSAGIPSTSEPPNRQSIMNPIPDVCTLCRTTMTLVDRQPVDHQYDVLFLSCAVCGSSAKRVTGCEALALAV
jgi:hypothetical protein